MPTRASQGDHRLGVKLPPDTPHPSNCFYHCYYYYYYYYYYYFYYYSGVARRIQCGRSPPSPALQRGRKAAHPKVEDRPRHHLAQDPRMLLHV